MTTSPTFADLALLDALTDAEADNFRTMIRQGEIEETEQPTLGTTLDSWRQMPDFVRESLSDTPEEVQPTLERLIADLGADTTIESLYDRRG